MKHFSIFGKEVYVLSEVERFRLVNELCDIKSKASVMGDNVPKGFAVTSIFETWLKKSEMIVEKWLTQI